MKGSPQIILDWIVRPYLNRGRVDVVIVGLFLLINSVVFINAHFHNRNVIYDVQGHMAYVKALVKEHRLPSEEETFMFYAAPLPYVGPALAKVLFDPSYSSLAKGGQYFNVLISLLLTYFLLRLAYIVSPTEPSLRASTLLLIGILPVYYKTMAMGIRGEPYLVLFTVVSTYLLITLTQLRSQTYWRFELLGVCLGLLLLSKQTGLSIFPGVIFIVLYIFFRSTARHRLFHGFLMTVVLTILIGGWFYYHQLLRHGSLTPFNQPPRLDYANYVEQYPDLLAVYEKMSPDKLSMSQWGKRHYELHGKNANRIIKELSLFKVYNKENYFGTGNGKLFSSPVREAFPSQLVPIFYTSMWGNYWGKFLWPQQRGHDRITKETHLDMKEKITPYLGRVNLVSLIPTIVLLGGFVFGLMQLVEFSRAGSRSKVTVCNAFFVIVIIGTLIGYLLFLHKYPGGHGNSNNATYVLHIFPFLAILGAQLLMLIKHRNRFVYRSVVAIIIAISVHNSSAMITGVTESFKVDHNELSRLEIPHEYH